MRHLVVIVIVATVLTVCTPQALAQSLVITGVLDGPLTGGIPKVIELYAPSPIADLSIYGLESVNSPPTFGTPEFTFPADSVGADTFIYVVTDAASFLTYFGFAADYVNGVASINGDDAIRLYQSGVIIDSFGNIEDGSGTAWDYLDSWASRVLGTGPDGTTFVAGNWTFGGVNSTDGCTDNATCSSQFPIGTYPIELLQFDIE